MRTPPSARALTAVAIGSIGVAVGAGIGVRHLSVAGWSATAAAAVVAGAAGLVLLVWGIVVAVRITPGWWRLLAVPAVVALLAFVILPLGVALAVTNVPPTELGDETPDDRGLAFRDASFTTDDGVELSGWYLPSGNGAAVVLLHGATSTRSNVLDEAEVLARAGFGVLAFDARGHGESSGTAMDFGWYGERDTRAAVTWLSDQPDVDPDRIGAVGSSMGGEEVLGALGADDRLRAAVAEGATGRVRADRAWLPRGPAGWLQRGIDRVQYAAIDLLTDASPPPSLRDAVASAAPRPVLLIVAGDVPEEADAASHIATGSPATVEVWEVDGAGHVEGLATAPDEWERRVVDFLEEHLAA